METGPDGLLTVDEVAVILRCSRNYTLLEIQRGNLRATMSARRWLVSQRDLDHYLSTGANVAVS